MANLSKNLLVISAAATGLVALAAVLDLVLQFPFGRHVILDIMFLAGAGLVGYMVFEAYRDLA